MFFKSLTNPVQLILILLGMPVLCTAAIFNEDTGHFYEIVSSGESGAWINAEFNARALGGNLVTINDKKEEDWLRSTFGTDKYWIGFTDAGTEGKWEWTSGETVTYTNWRVGEPNNSSTTGATDFGEDFAVLNWGLTGEWNDWTILRPDRVRIGSFEGIAEFPVPIPASLFLFGSALISLIRVKRHGQFG
jgi:hypothetical protein